MPSSRSGGIVPRPDDPERPVLPHRGRCESIIQGGRIRQGQRSIHLGKNTSILSEIVHLIVLGCGCFIGPEEIQGAIGQLGQGRILVCTALSCWRCARTPNPRRSVPSPTRIFYYIIG